jgi:hypothetical protein
MGLRDQEQLLGSAKFSNCIAPLKGKGCESKRVICACLLIRNFYWRLITDPDTRKAIDIAEAFATGKASQEQVQIAKKIALGWRRNREWKGDAEEFERRAYILAYLLLKRPFGFRTLNDVSGRIASSLKLEFKGVGKKTDKDASDYEDAVYKKMAAFVMKFLKRKDISTSETPSMLDDPRLKKFHVKYLSPYVWRDWIVMNVESKSDKKRLLAAIDCFFKVAITSTFSLVDLAPIQRVACSEVRQYREIGVKLLLLLGMHHPVALEALFEVFCDRSAEVRFTMISLFGYYNFLCSKEYTLKVVAKGINDASAKVREFTVEASRNYEMKECLPLLIARQAIETNKKVRDNLEFNIPLIRDGYFVEADSDGTYSLVVSKAGGVVSTGIQKEDLEPERLKELVKRQSAKI